MNRHRSNIKWLHLSVHIQHCLEKGLIELSDVLLESLTVLFPISHLLKPNAYLAPFTHKLYLKFEGSNFGRIVAHIEGEMMHFESLTVDFLLAICWHRPYLTQFNGKLELKWLQFSAYKMWVTGPFERSIAISYCMAICWKGLATIYIQNIGGSVLGEMRPAE